MLIKQTLVLIQRQKLTHKVRIAQKTCTLRTVHLERGRYNIGWAALGKQRVGTGMALLPCEKICIQHKTLMKGWSAPGP